MKKFSEMTDQEVAETIAETMEWYKVIHQDYWRTSNGGMTGWRYKTWTVEGKNLWNPLHSLDQCAVFEKWLKETECYFSHTWLCNLAHTIDIPVESVVAGYAASIDKLVSATAFQRCEAFLKTTGGCK